MTIFKTALFCAAMAFASVASAQTNINLGVVNADPTAPVEITADNLEIDQTSGTAVFTGNVVVGQNDLRLTAARVLVNYDDASGEISSLNATGGVTFVTPTEAAEAQSADYNLDAGTLNMMGDVLLTQGASAIASDVMLVEMSTGAAQMNGNVRTIFNQGGN